MIDTILRCMRGRVGGGGREGREGRETARVSLPSLPSLPLHCAVALCTRPISQCWEKTYE